jgi:hypothetical protein
LFPEKTKQQKKQIRNSILRPNICEEKLKAGTYCRYSELIYRINDPTCQLASENGDCQIQRASQKVVTSAPPYLLNFTAAVTVFSDDHLAISVYTLKPWLAFKIAPLFVMMDTDKDMPETNTKSG